MDPSYIFRGIIIGFSIAAPVGQIGVLCIRRTLTEGRTVGFVSGLGAATADAVYGCVAAFGLTAISAFLIDQQIWFRLFGGLFLLYLGVKTLLCVPPREFQVEARPRLVGAYSSTFLLTLTNPSTILSFAAIFAGVGLGASEAAGAGSAAMLVAGVFVGSAIWWFILSGAVSLLRSRFTAGGLAWVNRVSGAVIAAFGLAVLASLVPLLLLGRV
jgi:threonine/homoserine/homoserine lactone efflux protein